RPDLRPVERQLWRDVAIVLGLAAVLVGLLGVTVSGPDYHGSLGLPWGAVIAYLCGAAVLRVLRTQPIRSGATRWFPRADRYWRESPASAAPVWSASRPKPSTGPSAPVSRSAPAAARWAPQESMPAVKS